MFVYNMFAQRKQGTTQDAMLPTTGQTLKSHFAKLGGKYAEKTIRTAGQI